jgi:phage terminase small subunit
VAGVKGRGGRPRLSVEAHLLAGTYRRDRHGELPPGVRKLASVPKMAAARSELCPPTKYLSADDCPKELSTEARALWATLVVTRPVEALYSQLLSSCCEGWASWCRATLSIQRIGDLVRIGGSNRPVVNPSLRLQRHAQGTMLTVAKCLNWTPVVARGDLRTDAVPSRLDQFLAAKQAAGLRRRKR